MDDQNEPTNVGDKIVLPSEVCLEEPVKNTNHLPERVLSTSIASTQALSKDIDPIKLPTDYKSSPESDLQNERIVANSFATEIVDKILNEVFIGSTGLKITLPKLEFTQNNGFCNCGLLDQIAKSGWIQDEFDDDIYRVSILIFIHAASWKFYIRYINSDAG